jgi:hypothetical protein
MTQYYRCNHLLTFAMQSQWILTSTSYLICFLSLYCSTWLLHTQANTHSLVVLFLWAIPRRLNFIWRHFRTLCLFLLLAYTDAGESPKSKNTTFRILRKIEIKKHSLLLHHHSQFVHHSNNNTLQSVYPPHFWNSIICTKDSNLNWEWTLFRILNSLQFRCFHLQVYSTAPSPRVALLHVLG